MSVARHNAQGCNSKSRVVISKKYQGKDLYLAFPADGRWYLVLHDELSAGLQDHDAAGRSVAGLKALADHDAGLVA